MNACMCMYADVQIDMWRECVCLAVDLTITLLIIPSSSFHFLMFSDCCASLDGLPFSLLQDMVISISSAFFLRGERTQRLRLKR